ncbi:MAG: helix-hairpin-helix domain-containing protein, partial [Clostridia bacterium]|nr:helix-hairpin-helix domain-containing protein [Clostridia bacterium]
GVDVNTASPSLLTYVAGLNSSVAKNIEKYRADNGAFKTREDLKKVSKLGDKAYEQCAGFLRIVGGDNILDNTGVHPESYAAVYRLLKYFNLTREDIKNGNLALLPAMVEKEGLEKVASTINVGAPTLQDIINELIKPGRDVRDELPKPQLKSELLGIENLKKDMVLTGVVRNVTDFGAFVDISVHQDGLVHISQISKDYIKHPSDVLKVGDVVRVKVLDVDVEKKRISLTIKDCPPEEE